MTTSSTNASVDPALPSPSSPLSSTMAISPATTPLRIHYLSERFRLARLLSPSRVLARVNAGCTWYRLEEAFCTAGAAGTYSKALISPDGDLYFVSDRYPDGPTLDCPNTPVLKLDYTLIPLAVPFADKDEAKGLGAVWDSSRKVWACAPDEVSRFEKWLAPAQPSSTAVLSDFSSTV